jgi:septal ring factor EnvC (AmiA/AmiB activator)
MKVLRTVMVCAAAALLGGCSALNAFSIDRGKAAAPTAAKFEQKDQAPTAVENALMWSEKYAKLNDQMTQEKARSQLLSEDNNRLKDQNLELKSQLDQAQKELAEANALLIDMRKELNNWKTDVLGYRDEMRAAHKAQLETLAKIVTILGGEPSTLPADVNPAAKTEKTQNEPNK